MKPFYKTICCLFFLLIFSFVSTAQYVTLVGKQFKDENGANFYPMVCNYITIWANDGSNYFLTTPLLNKYATAAECRTRIQQDFHQIKQMGFNTIRLMGTAIDKTSYDYPKCVIPPPHQYKSHFAITYEHFHYSGANSCGIDVYEGNGEGRDFLDINAPYDNSNADLQTLFNQLDLITSMAEAEGLKIILVTGGGNFLVNIDVYPDATGYSGTIQDQHAADYAALLAGYANRFQNNTTILAYDVWNEPQWNEKDYFHTKAEVCQWTAQWYDALKSTDPNHLITMSMAYWNDVLEWDVSVTKLDFVSQHIYPVLSPADNYSLTAALDRFHNDWIWVANNSPMPWVVTETSFSASNNSAPYNTPPYTNGSEADQASFTESSLNLIRNAGGSGYGWWLFQDVAWFAADDPINAYLNWYGLMRYADPVGGVYNSSDEKPAVDMIRNYLDANGNPPPITPATATSSYYNPFNHPANPVDNFGQPSTITGNVTDQNGQPIEDALVLGYTMLYIDNTDPFNLIYHYDSHYTFTDANGSFTIYPYDYDLRPPNNNVIEDFKISAFGTERVERGWGSTMNPSAIGVTNGENFTLQQTDLLNDAVVSGVTVSGTQNFEARQTLTITDVVVSSGANSDFKAAMEVNAGTEFHAVSGSETHLFTEIVYPECTDFTGYLRQKNPMSDAVDEETTTLSAEIEIQFKKILPELGVVIQPNPNQGKYTLLLETSDTMTVQANLEIYSLTGNKVHSQVLNTNVTEINLTYLVKGIYIINIIQNNKIINKKLIIQ